MFRRRRFCSASSKEIFSSWPASALVDGRENRFGQFGGFLQTRRQFDAADGLRFFDILSSRCRKDSRARCTRWRAASLFSRSSSGARVARRTAANFSATDRRPWRADGSARARKISRTRNSEICVSTSPLRGMPLGMMTSKAEMRSLATSRKASPRSKTSRTLPERIFLMPGRSSCRIGSFAQCVEK